MSWQQSNIDRLKDYKLQKTALVNIPEQLEVLELKLTAIRAATADETAVKGGGSKTREDSLIDILEEKRTLERKLDIAQRTVEIIERCLNELTEEQQKVLLRLFVNNGRVENLCKELNLEKSRVYEIRNEALRSFAMAYCGVVDL